jgi:hypothetical protein
VTFGGARGRNLLLLVALLATLVVLGCWDNRREMEHVLDQGYATTAQLTGAQYQRKMPFAADGWRPRFVEQDLSVDLSWQGKDGKPHEHKKVPVSEAFASTIVSGDQVRLVTLPVKVLDDDTAVPVITADTAGRFASLQTWLTISGYIALAAWAGFAAATLFGRRPAAGTVATAKPADIPPRRTLLGLVLLVGGGFLAFQAWSEGQSNAAIAVGGKDVVAEITDATTVTDKSGGGTSHTVRLSWKDGQGAVHHFGPTHISETFWNKITQNGQLAVHQTSIRVRDDDPQARPVIVDDAPELQWQVRFGMIGGLVMVVLGLGFLFSAVRSMSRGR